MKSFFKNSFQIVVKLVRNYLKSNGSYVAGSIAFFFLVSIIPMFLVLISIAGIILGNIEIALYSVKNFVSTITPGMPQQTIDLYSASIMKLINFIVYNRTATGLAGLLGLLWSSKKITLALGNAMYLILEMDQRKNYFHKLFDSILITFSIILLIFVSGILTFLFSLISNINLFGFWAELQRMVAHAGSWIASYIIAVMLYYVLYRIIPKKNTILKRYVLAAAFVGAFIWELFQFYGGYVIINASKYKLFYGQIAAFVYIIFWSYFFGLSFIFGVCLIKTLNESKNSRLDLDTNAEV